MSASREKKQRQGAGPSEKATQVKNEQAAYKRKARTYTIIGIVVVVLVAALIIWNSNMVQGGMTAATVGSEKLSVAELGYYYNSPRYQYLYYGLLDSSKSDAEQMMSQDKSFRDFFLETALNNAQDITALYNTALKEGYSVSDVADDVAAEIKAAKEAAAANSMGYKDYLKAMYGAYMTPGVFKDIVTKGLIANNFYSDKYDEILNSFSDADFQAYYEEHADELDEIEYSFLQFRPATVDTKDGDGKDRTEEEIKKLEEEAKAEAKKKAEAALKAYNEGTSIADLIKEHTPSASGDHSVTQGVDSLSTYYGEDLMKLGKDEAAMVETESVGYYIVVFHNRSRNETLAANVRHILAKAEHTTAADGTVTAPNLKLMEEAKAEAEAILDEFLAGNQTGEAFGELANKHSDDAGSNTKGGLYENVVEGNFVTELNDWMFGEEKPEVGATAVIAHEGDPKGSNPYWGYHVMYLESWGMSFWALDARDALCAETIDTWRTDLIKSGFEASLANGAKNLGN